MRSGYLDGLNAVSRRIVLELSKAENKSERIVGFLRRIYKPLDIAVPKEGKKAAEGKSGYTIAKQLGVYTLDAIAIEHPLPNHRMMILWY